MAISDFYPQMKGMVPAEPAPIPPAPSETVEAGPSQNPGQGPSPYIRTTIPLPFTYQPDSLRQSNTPGLSFFRASPLPPGGNAAVNAATTSSTTSSIQEFVNVAAAGPNGAVQYNNGGALNGVNQFVWDFVSSTLNINGTLTITTPLGVAYGGTGSNLAATGGASEVLLQTTVGGDVTVRQLTYADIGGSPVGAAIWNTIAKSSAYNAVAGDMVLANTTGAGFTVTIPSAAANKNKSIRVKKVSSDANIITVAAADNIDGLSSQAWTSQYTEIEIISDGTTWWIV